eukprot:scpid91274/ scgid16438/ 
MFADDKTVYSSDPSKARSEAKLSSALEILNNHLGSIGMQINTDKTVVMQIHPKRATGSQQQQQRQQLQITLSNVTLGEVESTRCLGVVVDNKLSFDQHILKQCRPESLTQDRCTASIFPPDEPVCPPYFRCRCYSA